MWPCGPPISSSLTSRSGTELVWVADLTYVKTQTGWADVAFMVDVYSRRIVG